MRLLSGFGDTPEQVSQLSFALLNVYINSFTPKSFSLCGVSSSFCDPIRLDFARLHSDANGE